MTSVAVCGHDPGLDCGCWLDDTGVVRRHAFRFLPGDRVHWTQWPGVTGTVKSRAGTGRYYVEWDEHCRAWAPTSHPDILQICRLEVTE